MSPTDTLVELDLRRDEHAPTRVARVRPEALVEIVRATVSIGGAIWIRVTGKSMNPIIRHGDRVFVTALRGMPRRGMVLLLDANGTPLLHRVASYRVGWVVTKGDSRTMNDEPHAVTAILGRAVVVRRGRATICLAPTLAFGFAPLVRGVAWWLRTRVPNTWFVQLRQVRAHGR